jgi:hypothetical protein
MFRHIIIIMKRIINLSIITAIGLTMTSSQVKAEAGWASIIGPIVGVPVGGVAGLVRGAFSKASEYSDTFSESLGGHPLSKIVGIPTGFVTGAVTGSVTGLLKGVLDGVVLGITEPLSPESGSLQGDVLDYEPYNILDFGKTKAQ